MGTAVGIALSEGVAVGGTRIGEDGAPPTFVVAVAVGGDLVRLGLGEGLVGPGFGGYFVGEGPASDLAVVLASRIVVSAV